MKKFKVVAGSAFEEKASIFKLLVRDDYCRITAKVPCFVENKKVVKEICNFYEQLARNLYIKPFNIIFEDEVGLPKKGVCAEVKRKWKIRVTKPDGWNDWSVRCKLELNGKGMLDNIREELKSFKGRRIKYDSIS